MKVPVNVGRKPCVPANARTVNNEPPNRRTYEPPVPL